MNLRTLQYFVVLAEELNFSRAAERLHVAQPALSQQIRSLEKHLGAQLVDRGRRLLRLTEAGSYLFTEASQILASYEQVVLGTRGLSATDRNRIFADNARRVYGRLSEQLEHQRAG